MSFSNKYQIRNIPNLSGGLNDFADPTEIRDNEMASCENFEVDDKTIKTAPGYVMYDGSPVADRYWGIFHARFSSGTQRLIRQRGTTLEYDNGSGTWTNCTLPNYASPATTVVLSQVQCSFEMLNDIVLWSNGTDSVMSSTDGITWTLRSSLPKAKKLLHNGLNRILYLAQPAVPSRIDWSDINDPLTVGASNYQFIGKNDSDDIVDAVITPTGGLFVNKTTRFYSISDVTEGTVSVDPLGYAPCVGRTAVSTENSIIWAGPNGEIYEYSGQVGLISGNLSRSNISPANISLMTAVYFNGKYRLALPEGSNNYNSIELVVNRKLFTGKNENPYVITRNRRNIGCYGVENRFVSSVSRTRLYFGASLYTALFAYINDFRDSSVTQGLNGASQTCYFSTKFFQEDNPYYLKRYVKSFIDIFVEQSTDFTLSYRFDKNGQWTDVSRTATGEDTDWVYDSGETGGFSEGYSFSGVATNKIFQDLEKSQDPFGIQLKITVSTNKDVSFYGLAYKFLTKPNFH